MTAAAPVKYGWIPRVLRGGSVLAWHNLLALLWLNVLWLVCTFSVVLAGPATLTVYGYLADLRDDAEPRPQQLVQRFTHNLLSGLLWALAVALFAFLAYANLTFWPRVLGQFGMFVVWIFWGYLTWLFAALQPYLLEALTVEHLPYRRAWKVALVNVIRQPIAAHLWVLIPLMTYLIGRSFHTLGLAVLVSLVLTYAAVHIKPVTVRPPPLDEETEMKEQT